MAPFKIMNPLPGMIVAATILIFACQETNKNSDSKSTLPDDSVTTGLEGTRDQNAQVGGSDVKIDTSAGQANEKAGTGGPPGNSETTAQFLSDEVSGNYAEVRMAKLALQNSSNADIKSLAKILENDHASSLRELKNLASDNKMSIPTGESAEQQNKISDLSGKKGSEFDKAWCTALIEKHEKTISRYEDMVKNTSDMELKKWINNTIPKLRVHHDKLMECRTRIKS